MQHLTISQNYNRLIQQIIGCNAVNRAWTCSVVQVSSLLLLWS